MLLIQRVIESVEVIHQKGDDFAFSFEFSKEDGSPFDLESVSLRWNISRGGDLLVSIDGNDLEINGNQVTFKKSNTFFESMSVLIEYQHKLFDSVSNSTLIEGPFRLNP